MTHFMRQGNTVTLVDNANVDISSTLAPAVYIVKFNTLAEKYYLETAENFKIPGKLYGDTARQTQRILATFNSRESTTGVMLVGEKGSGKSLLAKNIASEALALNVPTIIVAEPFCGPNFNKFMQDIDTPAVVMLDEFEKVYDREDQEHMLTLLDGAFNSKKLFLLTCNDEHKVDRHMRNRPGRIYYLLTFEGVEESFVREYCDDNLQNADNIAGVVAASKMFSAFNFDMLQALVEEMNRFGETAREAMAMLNARPTDSGRIDYVPTLEVDGKIVKVLDSVANVNPLNDNLEICYHETAEDETNDTTSWLYFNTLHLEHYNADKCEYVFFDRDNNARLRLTRADEFKFDYRKYLS